MTREGILSLIDSTIEKFTDVICDTEVEYNDYKARMSSIIAGLARELPMHKKKCSEVDPTRKDWPVLGQEDLTFQEIEHGLRKRKVRHGQKLVNDLTAEIERYERRHVTYMKYLQGEVKFMKKLKKGLPK